MSQSALSRHVLEPLLDMRRDFDHAFDHFFRHHALHPALSETVFAAVPLIESWVDENDKQFYVTMPLPGLTPEEITLHQLAERGVPREAEEQVRQRLPPARPLGIRRRLCCRKSRRSSSTRQGRPRRRFRSSNRNWRGGETSKLNKQWPGRKAVSVVSAQQVG